MELPSGNRGYLTLEIHYYNTNPGQPAEDRSGVELCLANEKREHTATQHWLGAENINVPPNAEATAGDTCTPNSTQDETSTLISVTPHMHKIGTHATLETATPLRHAVGSFRIRASLPAADVVRGRAATIAHE